MGVRFNVVNRVCIERKIETKTIAFNGVNYEVNFKISFIESDKGTEMINIKPEYEDLKRIADGTGLSIKKIQLLVQAELSKIYHDFKL